MKKIEFANFELSNMDIQMTKGMAIITMLFLHLFCLPNKNIIGIPFIVLPNGVPLLYYMGWLSAICAPLFCICNGYAHYMQGLKGGLSTRKRLRRYLKFMIHYALAVLFVAFCGLLYGGAKIPGSLLKFVFNFLAIDYSYTGIWWYVWFYVCYVICSEIFYKIINTVSFKSLVLLIILQFFIVEATRNLIMGFMDLDSLLFKIYDHLYYLLGARMLCYFGGMLVAKHKVISFFKYKINTIKATKSNFLIIVLLILSSLLLCVFSKGILLAFYSFFVFLAFNCFKHCVIGIKIFKTLGKYSLYIWLLHPFIYTSAFPFVKEWLLSFKYSLLIWFILFAISLGISFFLTRLANTLVPCVNKMIKC